MCARYFRNLLIVSSLIVLSISPLPARAAAAVPSPFPGSFADLVDKLSPAVVNISTTQKVKGGAAFGMPLGDLPDDPQMEPFRDFMERFGEQFGAPGRSKGDSAPEQEVTSLGSGFIIDASGYIITNYHVIDGAEDVTVTFTDNSKYTAKIIGRDKKTDLALLKIDAKKPLPFVNLGDSDKVRVGDWVIAIGNPYGLGGSVTHGIISARSRSINAGPYDDFLQTDAPINRGNSGGPLFNETGEVIGITSAIFSPSGGNIGIGFAIPASIARPVIEQLKQFGRTHRAWLGVKIQEVSDEVAESVGLSKVMGALVVDVSKGGPADKAGIKVGDVITQFDGHDISEMRFLPRMVAETKIGKSADLTVWRGGKSVTVKATLEELDESQDEASAGKPGKPKSSAGAGETVLGMELAALTPQLRERFGLDEKTGGLVVLGAERGSEARKRGVDAGVVLMEAGGATLKTVAELKAAVAAVKKSGRKFILLKVLTDKDTAFITLPVEEKK